MIFRYFFISFAILSSCASGHCRRVQSLQNDKQISIDSESIQSQIDQNKKVAQNNKTLVHIFVFKEDGSLQCSSQKGISETLMAKELSGVTVYSAQKKSDGLIHMASCGSKTGMINIFEIDEKSLEFANSRGFKVLKNMNED